MGSTGRSVRATVSDAPFSTARVCRVDHKTENIKQLAARSLRGLARSVQTRQLIENPEPTSFARVQDYRRKCSHHFLRILSRRRNDEVTLEPVQEQFRFGLISPVVRLLRRQVDRVSNHKAVVGHATNAIPLNQQRARFICRSTNSEKDSFLWFSALSVEIRKRRPSVGPVGGVRRSAPNSKGTQSVPTALEFPCDLVLLVTKHFHLPRSDS